MQVLLGLKLKKELWDNLIMLILRKEAEDNIKEAYEWYEAKHIGLGIAFVSEVETALHKIPVRPEMYGQVFKNIRRTLCKRFPYSIYFIESSANIVVLAVLHQRRDPAAWQKRI